MSFYTPQEIMNITAENGLKKSKLPFWTVLILGFLGGAFISLGFLADIRVIGTAPKELGSITGFFGAAVFPVGLMLTILAGAELLTGNMMVMAMSWFAKKITLSQVVVNWVLVLLSNFIGAIAVAYFFGHVVGLTEGDFLAKTLAIAHAKVGEGFGEAFVSAIGCNWLVCLAVWLAYGSKDSVGKFVGIWFPIMAFVAIGFQHVIANMFVIPAAIFAGSDITWTQYVENFVPVFLGNLVGGAIFVALAYFGAYRYTTEASMSPEAVSDTNNYHEQGLSGSTVHIKH
ncbi:formate/nitrite transporter family protein [Paenibacillus sp. PsM32]|uniref:formate/nitrite transporter family protein n=1 Tax=Paenibacillus sp. PsM32 TaxID=3030536 RepID=UPI00263B150B|nr:formate/nitrite transporter family protein [Paenibacillus sp. PsM32]MDN4618892.1 formate/nitrite transporter family protein [Paenibacillus sp. PsM32]